jgi:hypothetical protein
VSKRRRDRGESNDDLLNDLSHNDVPEPTSELTVSSFANAGYGSRVGDDIFPELNKGKIKVFLIPIDLIYPDSAQPRRTTPSSVRQYWDGQPDSESMAHLFEKWLQEVKLEKGGKDFELEGYLTGASTERAPAEISEIFAGKEASLKIASCELALLQVVSLAASIKRDGLTNPITVVQRDRYHAIETGERRWLAYQLLNWYFGNQNNDWSKIPARVVEKINIWRQATENNARADLNAIAKARQLALLIMDLYTTELGTKFRPFELFKTEQAFYAQVADPIQYKILYGKGELILNAMGFDNKSTIKRYRDLLSLPSDIWTRADDFNVPESVLRQMVTQPPEKQLVMFGSWLDNGRLHPEDAQRMIMGREGGKQFGKFSRLLDFEIQQWQGEYEDLDDNSRELVLRFIRELLETLSSQ